MQKQGKSRGNQEPSGGRIKVGRAADPGAGTGPSQVAD